MVGAALQTLVPEAIFVSSDDCDLRNYDQTLELLTQYEPHQVVHLAAKVGGIQANMNHLGDFYRENNNINTNVLEAARMVGVSKLVSVLSTCVYPDKVQYPLTEDQIHDGPPHPSNYAYAYAKRMLDVQSRAYRDQYGCNFVTIVPNNLFGEHDNYDLNNSHVIPAITRKIYEATLSNTDVHLWGDGTPLREFTYSGDLARIILFVMKNYNGRKPLNVGNTVETSIKEVAILIGDLLGFRGTIWWDTSKPKGQQRKPSDNTSLLNLGWKSKEYSTLRESLNKTCKWFTMNYPNLRGIK